MPMARSKGATGGLAGTLGLGVLAAASVALAWYVADGEIDVRPLPPNGPQQIGSPAAPRPGAAAIPTVPLTPRPLATYGGTLDRPLFEPSRRPRPAVVEPVEQSAAGDTGVVATVADDLRIVGIMRSKKEPAAARALVRSTDAPQAVWVETGASIGGWRVAAIGERTVTVESGGQRREISLFAAAGSDKTAP